MKKKPEKMMPTIRLINGVRDIGPAKMTKKMIHDIELTTRYQIASSVTAAMKKRTALLYRQEMDRMHGNNRGPKPKLTSLKCVLTKAKIKGKYEVTSMSPMWIDPCDIYTVLEKTGWTPVPGVWDDYRQKFVVQQKEQSSREIYYVNKMQYSVPSSQCWYRDGAVLYPWIQSGTVVCKIYTSTSDSSSQVERLTAEYYGNSLLKNKFVEVNNKIHIYDKPDLKHCIIGEDHKNQLQIVSKMIQNWNRLEQHERKLGIVIAGITGTGKTAFISSLLNENAGKVTAISLRGNSKGSVENVFKWLEALKTPAILILEDFDTIAQSRLNVNGNNLIGELLETFDGEKQYGVITIATTNHPEQLDSAMTRPGRLGISVWFTYPNAEHKKSIIDFYVKHYGISISPDVLYKTFSGDRVTGAHISEVLKGVARDVKLGVEPLVALKVVAHAYLSDDNIHVHPDKMNSGRDKMTFK